MTAIAPPAPKPLPRPGPYAPTPDRLAALRYDIHEQLDTIGDEPTRCTVEWSDETHNNDGTLRHAASLGGHVLLAGEVLGWWWFCESLELIEAPDLAKQVALLCHTTRPSVTGKGSGGTSNGVDLCGGWWPRKDVLGRNRA